jgi:DNA polymerase-1
VAGWDREAVHRVFDTLQFRVLRDRLYEYLEAVEPEAESGFDLPATVLASGQVAGWLTGTRRRAPVGVAVPAVRPRHRRADRARGGHRGRPAAGSTRTPSTADETASRSGSPTRTGPRSSTTPSRRAGVRAHGWRWPAFRVDTASAYLAKPDHAPTT